MKNLVQEALDEKRKELKKCGIVEEILFTNEVGKKKIVYIPLSYLHIDETFQRVETFNIKKCHNIVSNFRESSFDIIKVYKRDGLYSVADGQHRIYAALLQGKTHIVAYLVEGTYIDEVTTFLSQKGSQGNLKPYDIYKAGLCIGHKTDKILHELCNRHCVAVLPNKRKNSVGALQSITRAKNIIEWDGADAMDWVFNIIYKLKWNDKEGGYSSIMLRGWNVFRKRFEKEGCLKEAEKIVIKLLKNISPNTSIIAAKSEYPHLHSDEMAFSNYIINIVEKEMEEKQTTIPLLKSAL